MNQHEQPAWLMQHAKTLRKQMTDAEHRLWYYLRAKRLNGIKFRRQVPIYHYVADFLCISSLLIIELDGSQHQQAEQVVYDQKRTHYFEFLGYRVLRISNEEIFNNISGVLEKILQGISQNKT